MKTLTEQEELPQVYLDLTIESLFRSLCTLEVHGYSKRDSFQWGLELIQDHKKGQELSVVQAQSKDGRLSFPGPQKVSFKGSSGKIHAALTLAGSIQDSGWIHYPLLIAWCKVRFKISPCQAITIRVIFPKFCHLLPDYTGFRIDGERHAGLCDHIGYPDVQQVSYLTLENVKQETEIEFEAIFREAAINILMSTVFPLVLNSAVILTVLVLMPGTLPQVKVPIVLGVTPFYFTLMWYRSNVLRSIPAFINFIVTLTLSLLLFNMIVLASSWASSTVFWASILSYIVVTIFVIYEVFRFIFFGPLVVGYEENGSQLVILRLQKALEIWYNKLKWVFGPSLRDHIVIGLQRGLRWATFLLELVFLFTLR